MAGHRLHRDSEFHDTASCDKVQDKQPQAKPSKEEGSLEQTCLSQARKSITRSGSSSAQVNIGWMLAI